MTIPHDARLPAPPSARTLATLRDDPLEPVAIYHHRAPPPPEVETTGCRRLVAIAIGCTVGPALVELIFGPEVFVATVVALLGFGVWRSKRLPTVDLDGAGRPEDLPRPLPIATPSGRPVRPLGPMHTADQAVIDLKRAEGPPGGGFDPSDRPHRDVADLIHACRSRDGLGLTGPPIAHDPGALIASIEPFGASGATLEERLHQWARIAGFVEAHPNPQAVWLAAVASREATSARRGAAALGQLAATAGQQAQLDRVLGFIDAEGHWCARGAAAVHRADAEALARLIAEAPAGQIDSLSALMEARWALAPDPALFDAWAAGDDQGLALVRAALADAGAIRWRALLSAGAPEVAGQAVRAMLGEAAPLPLLGARALLNRPDIRRLFADGHPSQALREAASGSVALLARAGVADDLRCLGVWGGDPWVGELARRGQRTLKARVGADALGDAGGLALAADEAVSGGLSPADGGGLSPAEPEGR